MIKFHVVLDTNIYRKNPSRSDLAFQALERLCLNKIVKLHLPYIVEREFQTQQVTLYQKDLDTTISGLEAILRKELSPKLHSQLKKVLKKILATKPSILSEAEGKLVVWANAIGAQRHVITKKQAVDAMESYFLGQAPLKSPKIRNDIPDSFLYQTIKQLSTYCKPLIVIAEDEKIAQASEAIIDVAVFRNLFNFIKSDDVQREILELDVIDNLSLWRNAFEDFEKRTSTVSNVIGMEGGKALDMKTVQSDLIPDDNNEAIITSYDNITNIDIGFNETFYYGKGEFGIPFSGSTTVGITYYIFKSDYYCMNEDDMPSVSEHNEHYFEAQEDVDVSIIGLVKLSTDESVMKTFPIQILDENIEISIDHIDSIEIDR